MVTEECDLGGEGIMMVQEHQVQGPTYYENGNGNGNREELKDICLFLANLPGSFTDSELEHHLCSLLSRYGTIVSAKAGRDKRLRPYCFLQFMGVVDDEVLVQKHYLGGRMIRAEVSRTKSFACYGSLDTAIPGVPTKGLVRPTILLLVRGCNSRKAIFEEFKRFGYILWVYMGTCEDNSPVIYICYADWNIAELAKSSMDGKEVNGCIIECEVQVNYYQVQPEHHQEFLFSPIA